MYKTRSNFLNILTSHISSFYQLFFIAILPCMVFASKSLPLLIHFIIFTILLEFIYKQLDLKSLFFKNFRSFCFLNIICLLAFLSIIVSVAPTLSFKGACHLSYFINLGFIFFCGMQITTYQKQIFKGLWIGFVISLLLGIIESQTEGIISKFFYKSIKPLHYYNQYTSILIALLPFILFINFNKLDFFLSFYYRKPKIYLFFEKFIKLVFLFVSALVILKFQSDTSKLTLSLSIILLIILPGLVSNFKKIILQILICLCFALPILSTKIYNIPFVHKQIFNHISKASFYDRLSIWEYVQQLNLNHTLQRKSLPQQFLGFGMNSSRTKILSSSTRTWIQPNPKFPSVYKEYTSENIPLHPHNFVLQIWLELGLFGLIIIFFLLLLFVNYIFQMYFKNSYLIPTYLSFLNILIISSMGYGLWQSWWLCTISLSVAVSELLRRENIK